MAEVPIGMSRSASSLFNQPTDTSFEQQSSMAELDSSRLVMPVRYGYNDDYSMLWHRSTMAETATTTELSRATVSVDCRTPHLAY
jgi:hypothetical protein